MNRQIGRRDRPLSLLNMRYLFFEQRSGGGREENEATLTFQGSRTGIASWLALQAPGISGIRLERRRHRLLRFHARPRPGFRRVAIRRWRHGHPYPEV